MSLPWNVPLTCANLGACPDSQRPPQHTRTVDLPPSGSSSMWNSQGSVEPIRLRHRRKLTSKRIPIGRYRRRPTPAGLTCGSGQPVDYGPSAGLVYSSARRSAPLGSSEMPIVAQSAIRVRKTIADRPLVSCLLEEHSSGRPQSRAGCMIGRWPGSLEGFPALQSALVRTENSASREYRLRLEPRRPRTSKARTPVMSLSRTRIDWVSCPRTRVVGTVVARRERLGLLGTGGGTCTRIPHIQ
jgi:hypothetical protein